MFLILEYFLCGVYFRFARSGDCSRVNLICCFLSLGLCYGGFRKLMKLAVKEGAPILVVAVFFLIFSFLLGLFLRFNIQLANGLFDGSEAEMRMAYVTDKKISNFGGSIKDGINPMAHLVYFQEGDDKSQSYELLTRLDFYYSVDLGSKVELSVRKGFFHMPWIEDYWTIPAK